jgi:hypothetical protein
MGERSLSFRAELSEDPEFSESLIPSEAIEAMEHEGPAFAIQLRQGYGGHEASAWQARSDTKGKNGSFRSGRSDLSLALTPSVFAFASP